MSAADVTAILLSLGVLLASARILGELARRVGQPAILGEILAGLLLGPTVLGKFAPEVGAYLFAPSGSPGIFRSGLNQLSVTLFLLVAGMEIDLSAVWRQGRTAIAVSLSGIVIPFAIGFLIALYVPGALDNERGIAQHHFALFFATALSISALPVIAKTLMDINLFRTDLGVIVISAAICEDLIGWIVFAIVLGLIGKDQGHTLPIGETITWVVVFAVGMLTIGRGLFHRVLPWVQAYASWPGGVLGFVLTVTLFSAAFTEWIGVHAIFGAFMAGVALGDSPHLRERTRTTIEQFVSFFFAPLFFASLALKVDFIANFDLALVALVLVVACIGKVIGCGLGARLAGSPWRQSWAIGCAMNSRGAMEIILGTLALQYGVIGERLFVALVIMALVTSMLSGPLIQRILKRKKQRRFADHLGAKAFVARLRSADRFEAIRELVVAAAAQAGIDVEAATMAVSDRERQMATGLSNGIAVPHGRLAGLQAPVAADELARAGIDFDSPDGAPARIIILLLTPVDDDGAQLDLLADIARAFADPNMRELVMQVTSYTEFRALLKAERAA